MQPLDQIGFCDTIWKTKSIRHWIFWAIITIIWIWLPIHNLLLIPIISASLPLLCEYPLSLILSQLINTISYTFEKRITGITVYLKPNHTFHISLIIFEYNESFVFSIWLWSICILKIISQKSPMNWNSKYCSDASQCTFVISIFVWFHNKSTNFNLR